MIFSLLLLFGCPEPPEPSLQKNSQQNMNQTPSDQGSSNSTNQNNGGNPPPDNGSPQQNEGNTPQNNDGNTPQNNGENLPPRGGDTTNANQENFLNSEEEKKRLNPEMKGGYPENTGEIITNSILIRINESGDPDSDSNVDITQEDLQREKHISISGTIECNGEECDYPLVMRILPFVEIKPGEPPPENIMSGLVTTKVLSTKGDYTILVPKSKVAVIVEVLVDRNEDGLPTPGERMAVLDKGGQIVPYKNLKDMNLDVTNRKIEGPMGGPLSPDEPPPPGQD